MCRNQIVDVMKGIGIISVFLGHLCGFTFVESFHMPLFFIVAGYYFRPRPFYYMLKNDCRRLIFPYFVTSIISLLCLMLYRGDTARWTSYVLGVFGGFVYDTHVLYHNSVGVLALWFLPAMIVCRIVFNIIVRNSSNYIVLFLSCFIFSLFGVFIWTKGYHLPFGICQGLSALLFFYIGFRLHLANETQLYCEEKLLGGQIVLIAGAIWLIGVCENSMEMSDCYYSFFPVNIIISLAGVYMIYGISYCVVKMHTLNDFVSWIGINSLSFFILNNFDLLFGITCGYNSLFRFVINIIVCSIIVYLYDKIKIQTQTNNICNGK